MLIGIVANLVEFISIFCKDDDINPIIKCIDFISLAVLTIFQVPLCADYGKCISFQNGIEYIKFSLMTYNFVYQIFLIVILFGSISKIITVLALCYYLYLNIVSLRFLYISNYSNVITAVLISIKHLLFLIDIFLGIIKCCKKKKTEEVNNQNIKTEEIVRII